MPRLVNTQKIGVRYFSEAIVEINEITLEEPNSNCKVVKIKAERTCKDCGCTLVKGTRCYTFNPRLKPRYWVCFDCLPEPTTSVEREDWSSLLNYGYHFDSEDAAKSFLDQT